jgi:hypothetical protein
MAFKQVNVISLEPDKEDLRDTLFYSLFGNAILFNTFNDALVYRKYLVTMKVKPPMMFSLSGDKISASAVLDPGPSGRPPDSFEFLFGEQPSKQYAHLEALHGKKVLKMTVLCNNLILVLWT